MKINPLKLSAVIIVTVWLAASPATADVLLSDTFDNNLLDTNKWSTNTSLADGFGSPRLVVMNQRCEITARAYLNSVTNYDPATVGGLAISGTWTSIGNSAEDLPTVVTRCSGVPTGYLAYSGEPTEGIQFRVSIASPAQFIISGSGGIANVTGFTIVSNTLTLAQGDTINFSATDDGTNLSFQVTKVGNPSQGASGTAVCTNHFGVNKISFYNREFSGDTAGLDNVLVQPIVPPSPPLNIATATGNQSVLFWPASGTNYVLQSTTDLNSTNWVTVTNAVPVIAFTLTNGTSAQYFRLQSR